MRGRAGRWAGGGGELALRNDHNALEQIKSIKIAILGRHEEASASVGSIFNHCKRALCSTFQFEGINKKINSIVVNDVTIKWNLVVLFNSHLTG